jgi:hydroxymethylglutaryl-CoA lyase
VSGASRHGLASWVKIREVGPRDGLQPEEPIPVDDRVRLVEALVAAGAGHVEIAAFVSPKAVPAMAGAAEVVSALIDLRREEALHPGTTFAALVPNTRGAELALEHDIDELTVTISISETYNQRNVKRSVDESEADIEAICAIAGSVPVDAVISCAFGSPYEGDIEPKAVGELERRLRSAGCSEVTLADTTGMATPARIDDVIDVTGPEIGLHLHNTRGTALVNAYAALQRGVRRFDTSVGGLGGSPFAHGATGNLATEELVAMLDDLGVDTGIDVDGLVEAAALAADLVGHDVPSRVAVAGPRSRRA